MAFLFTMAKIAHLLVIFENPFFPIKNLHDNLKKYLPIQKLRMLKYKKAGKNHQLLLNFEILSFFFINLKDCQFYIVWCIFFNIHTIPG